MAIRKTTAKKSKAAKKVDPQDQNALREQIKERAYFIWLEKQMPDLDCWLQAENELLSRK